MASFMLRSLISYIDVRPLRRMPWVSGNSRYTFSTDPNIYGGFRLTFRVRS